MGGIRSSDQMSSAELFPRPLPGHPCSIPDLPDRRSDHTLSLISGERLVVCGGFDESLSILDSCLSWVDGNTSWTPLYTVRCFQTIKIIFIITITACRDRLTRPGRRPLFQTQLCCLVALGPQQSSLQRQCQVLKMQTQTFTFSSARWLQISVKT